MSKAPEMLSKCQALQTCNQAIQRGCLVNNLGFKKWMDIFSGSSTLMSSILDMFLSLIDRLSSVSYNVSSHTEYTILVNIIVLYVILIHYKNIPRYIELEKHNIRFNYKNY